MTNASLPLALTQGDPAGIGPDIATNAWARRWENYLPPFIFIGDPHVIASRAALISVDITVKTCEPGDAVGLLKNAFPVLPVSVGFHVQAGQPHVGAAHATIKVIKKAVPLAFEGKAEAIVTNSIGFPGYTEFLAELAMRLTGRDVLPVIMIAGSKVRVVPVTIHIPVKDIAEALTEKLIVMTCRIVDADLRQKFGTEDHDTIHPATIQLRKEGIDPFGPLPADTMFHDAAHRRYDLAICMYHDQALIPAKALGFDDSVNVTLGLPFIRTLPDYGAAFGIAGQEIASEASLVAALKMAADISVRSQTRA